MPRWLRALGSLRLATSKSAAANSPEFSLFAKTPGGQVHAGPGHRQAEARPAHPAARTRSAPACASTRAAAACSSGLRLLGEGERLGQRDRDVLRLRRGGGRRERPRGPGRGRRASPSSLSSRPTPPPGLARLPPLLPRAGDQAVADRVADPQHGRVGDAVEDPVAVRAAPPRGPRGSGSRGAARRSAAGGPSASRQLPHALLPPLQRGEQREAPLVGSALKRAATWGMSSASIIGQVLHSYDHANIRICECLVKSRGRPARARLPAEPSRRSMDRTAMVRCAIRTDDRPPAARTLGRT